MAVEILQNDLMNQLVAQFDINDKHIQSIIDDIEASTRPLLDDTLSSAKKFDIIVSIEYLLVRLRLEVEFEHCKVKQIVSDQSTPKTVLPLFVKRDNYLSQVSLKLTTIRNEIETLQKVVYTNSNFIKK